MLNTRLLNFHDIAVITFVVLLVHLLVYPLLARVGLTGGGSDESATTS